MWATPGLASHQVGEVDGQLFRRNDAEEKENQGDIASRVQWWRMLKWHPLGSATWKTEMFLV